MGAMFHLYDYEKEGHFFANRKRQLPISFGACFRNLESFEAYS